MREESEWIAFKDRWPPSSKALDDPKVKTVDTVLVTNNVTARDRMGRMSHVWLAMPIKEGQNAVAFTDGGAKLHDLTHWKDAGLSG